MDDQTIRRSPPALEAILRATEEEGFTMASEPRVGSLLAVLAASKPGGRLLELGSGTGVGTSWLLSGMDAGSSLDSVDNDEAVLRIARRYLDEDTRVTFHLMDGAAFLERCEPETYDLIYADTWPGKFTHLSLALASLKSGGIYLADDLLPQLSWPEDHAPKVPALIARLESQSGFVMSKLSWSSGLVLLAKSGAE